MTRWQKRQWLRDTRNNWFFSGKDTDQYSTAIWPQINTSVCVSFCVDANGWLDAFRSFSVLAFLRLFLYFWFVVCAFYFDRNASLACSCVVVGTTLKMEPGNTIADRCKHQNTHISNVKCKNKKKQRESRRERGRGASRPIRPNRKHCVQIKLTEEMWTNRSLKVAEVARLHCSPSLAAFNFNWINLKIDVYFTYLLHIALCFLCIFWSASCEHTQMQTYTYRESQAIFIKISLDKRIFSFVKNSTQSK